MNYLKYFKSFTKEKLAELGKTEKSYLKRTIKNDTENTEKYRELFKDLKNYDISNFTYNDRAYDFWIKPDQNFIELIKDINQYLEEPITLDLKFEFSYDVYNLNLVDFKKGIPELLQGIGIGYKLYMFLILKVDFLLTNKFASTQAINMWYSIVQDKRLYSFTSRDISGVIVKNQTNDKIKNILDNIKNYNSNVLNFKFEELIFDDELQEKIKEIYGSLDVYKQKN